MLCDRLLMPLPRRLGDSGGLPRWWRPCWDDGDCMPLMAARRRAATCSTGVMLPTVLPAVLPPGLLLRARLCPPALLNDAWPGLAPGRGPISGSYLSRNARSRLHMRCTSQALVSPPLAAAWLASAS
jgi:hypothetical protein